MLAIVGLNKLVPPERSLDAIIFKIVLSPLPNFVQSIFLTDIVKIPDLFLELTSLRR